MFMNEEVLYEKIRELSVDGRNTETNRHLAVSGLAEFVYFNLYRFKLQWFDEDTRSDFVLWLYPKFEGIVLNYNDERSSLKTYLYMMIRHCYRSFMKERFGSEARQRVFEQEEETRILSEQIDMSDSLQCQYTGSNEPANAPQSKKNKKPELTQKRKEVLARKILLLACKCSDLVDDALILQASELTGKDTLWFSSSLERIRERTAAKRTKVRLNREKQNMYYIRALGCAYEMQELDHNTARYRLLERRHEFCLKRLESARFQARHQNRRPSNREIARILGICRGTVDSTLASAYSDRYAVSS